MRRRAKIVGIGMTLLVLLPLAGALPPSGRSPWGNLGSVAHASGASLADQARSLLAQVLADESSRELVSRATTRSNDALARASAVAAQAPAQGSLLEAEALEWAELARDLKKARDAEQASDRLEQEVSSIQTEIVRSRAAVEQAMARVGRARQELLELETSKSPGAVAPKAVPTARPRPAEGH